MQLTHKSPGIQGLPSPHVDQLEGVDFADRTDHQAKRPSCVVCGLSLPAKGSAKLIGDYSQELLPTVS